MNTEWTKQSLIDFEYDIARLFEQGKINTPVHLSGGNEDQLIQIFKLVQPQDYVFSTWRSHYHYLLKGGDKNALIDEIVGVNSGMSQGHGRSLHLYDRRINFVTSAIVGGICPIAVGVGMVVKRQATDTRVWCFVGDGATDTAVFQVSVKYVVDNNLPVLFIVEDNDKAVESSKSDRGVRWDNPRNYRGKVMHYVYDRVYPHVGLDKWVSM